MGSANPKRVAPALLFAAIAVVVYAVALHAVRLLPRVDSPEILASGVALDLVVLVPITYYVLLVRSRRAPAITVVPVVLVSFAAASRILPAGQQVLLQRLSTVLPLAELGLAGWVVVQLVRRLRSATDRKTVDVPQQIRELLEEKTGRPVLAAAVAYELSLFYYAFRWPRRRKPAPEEFGHHERSGYGVALGVILMAAGAELFGVHLLLQRWSTTAAVIHVLVSLYGIAWLLGDYRALRAEPHRLGPGGLSLRTGLRWRMDVPLEAVLAVRRAYGPRPDELEGYRALVPLGAIDYLVELDADREAVGPYGLRRPVRRIGIQVDEPARFEESLRALGVPLRP